MLSAMARELIERNRIGESADAVSKALNREHQKLFPRRLNQTKMLLRSTCPESSTTLSLTCETS